MTRIIKIHPSDNVAVAIEPLKKDECVVVEGQGIWLKTDVRAGHKFLLKDLRQGENVIKYGYPIGHLRQDHSAGEEVDETAIETNLSGLLTYDWQPVSTQAAQQVAVEGADDIATFKGYVRKNGDVGIRNEVWIVPTVGCVNGICNQLREQFLAKQAMTGCALFPAKGKVDRVVAYNHNYGCSQLGDDHENTRAILRDLVLHPNAGAVLVVGLGCENNQPQEFMDSLGDYDKERIRLLVAQDVAGDEIDRGEEMLQELYDLASQDERTDVPISKLRIGLKCGGSDGFSGITANPLLGVMSDWLTARGGTTVLTEVPEMFGAETILMNRCKTRELFDQTVSMINRFKQYYLDHGQPVGENPSPGNKAGGISTLEEKALGCTQKSGCSAVCGVLAYGERLKESGLNLLSAPGNDLVASTALAASGCQLVLFTTGRGTPFGTFVPTLKVSTNTQLAERKPTWIDFNAGTLLSGTTMPALAGQFIRKIISVANGEHTCNEQKNYQEIAIFKNGVTL